jgi:parallel beta-helix repeat protein
VAIFATTTALALASSAGQAFASHVGCGDVITKDTKLDRDLHCGGLGIVIGADKVKLDLNGHTISGSDGLFTTGVENGRILGAEPGHRGVVIENGVIEGFDRGISLQHASHNLIRGLTLRCRFGIDMDFADNNRIEKNSISGGTSGILLERESHKNRIRANSMSDAGFGVSMFLQSDGNRIEGNVISRTDDGIAALTDGNRVMKNTVSHNLNVGIEVSGADNRVERNDVSWTSGKEPRGAGIWVASVNTLVRRNVTSHNEDDGIRVLSPEVTVSANTANFNGDFGIQAVEGVRDGARNVAFGNANPLQCLNVACNQ